LREIAVLYNSSIKFQVDTINSERHLHLLFPEFIEALCRLIDLESPIPPDESIV